MKAIVIHAARDLRVDDSAVEKPGPGEVEIRLASGGICGSDLHYYNHGGFGTVRLKEPMILGHEVAGHVAALGEVLFEGIVHLDERGGADAVHGDGQGSTSSRHGHFRPRYVACRSAGSRRGRGSATGRSLGCDSRAA